MSYAAEKWYATRAPKDWPKLECPKGHAMGWLGRCYWMCEPCHVIYVERPEVAA